MHHWAYRNIISWRIDIVVRRAKILTQCMVTWGLLNQIWLRASRPRLERRNEVDPFSPLVNQVILQSSPWKLTWACVVFFACAKNPDRAPTYGGSFHIGAVSENICSRRLFDSEVPSRYFLIFTKTTIVISTIWRQIKLMKVARDVHFCAKTSGNSRKNHNK